MGAECQETQDGVGQSLCSPNPCQHGGTCTDNISDFNCSCPVGYQGHRCQDDIPECDTQPCLNNGTCTELPGSYSCTCQPGSQGTNCELDQDECQESPCGQGTCINTVSITSLSLTSFTPVESLRRSRPWL